jgi:hypothetical protein
MARQRMPMVVSSQAWRPIEGLAGGYWYPHIFLAILVDGEVDGAERAATNLLLHQILVDTVLSAAVIFAVAVLGTRIEGFLGAVSLA